MFALAAAALDAAVEVWPTVCILTTAHFHIHANVCGFPEPPFGVVPFARSRGGSRASTGGVCPMTRMSAATLLVLVSLVSAGCADNLLKERPTTKAARATALKPTFSAAGSAKGESSVCSAYRRQLRVVQLKRMAQAGGKALADDLKAKELSLNAVIADACE
jgi:hypothetical protein